MTQYEREAPEATIEYDGEDIFVSIEGVRVAKRGHPGVPQATTWISLEPGYRVFDTDDGDIVIERTVQQTARGTGWIHEIKHDGYRLMARRDGASIRLLTRNGNNWSELFPAVAAAVGLLLVRSCLVAAG